jgi:hypothetical protein
VEPVAADAQLLIIGPGQGVVVGEGRDGLVKGRIENRHLGGMGKQLPGHV